jgi:voltage-gated sodium channel
MINLAGNWWRPFTRVVWNWMDAFVVLISIAGLINDDLPAIGVLRLCRVLKMVRLFRGLTQLRIMIDALYSAILPVVNASMLLLLVSTIYAIVGKDLFRELAPEYFGRSPTTSF